MHLLTDLITIAILAVIAGAVGWDDIETSAEAREPMLREFLDLPGGAPSDDTFRRLFVRLNPKAFVACLTAWMSSLIGSREAKLVALNERTLRRSFGNRSTDRGAGEGKGLQGQGPPAAPGGPRASAAMLLAHLPPRASRPSSPSQRSALLHSTPPRSAHDIQRGWMGTNSDGNELGWERTRMGTNSDGNGLRVERARCGAPA